MDPSTGPSFTFDARLGLAFAVEASFLSIIAVVAYLVYIAVGRSFSALNDQLLMHGRSIPGTQLQVHPFTRLLQVHK